MNRKPGIVLLALAMAFGSPVGAIAGDFNDGGLAWNARDYATALKLWRPFAEGGNVTAQFGLGWMYENGQGVPQDYVEAVKWYRLSAEQGNARAQYSLGFMFQHGQGVPQDYVEASKWYRLAAEQGEAIAQNSLAIMFANGLGVPQDFVEAVKWYRLAAEQGAAYAQANLGDMYANGYGVPQDYIQAHFWYNLAASRVAAGVDRDQYVSNRDRLAGLMTSDQIAEAQRLATEWDVQFDLKELQSQAKALQRLLRESISEPPHRW